MNNAEAVPQRRLLQLLAENLNATVPQLITHAPLKRCPISSQGGIHAGQEFIYGYPQQEPGD